MRLPHRGSHHGRGGAAHPGRAGIKVETILSAVSLRGAIDGFTLAQRTREGFGSVEVILTTGYVMTAKKAGELCDQRPRKHPHHPDLIVDRLKLFEKRRPRPG